jgi:hypothetical protein
MNYDKPTEADFLGTLRTQSAMPVCRQRWVKWLIMKRIENSMALQCEDVDQACRNDFDWIGTTHALSSEKFKILEQLGGVRYCPEISNQSKERIVKAELSTKALANMGNITAYDQSTYDRVRRDYPISMWRNFDPPQGLPPLHPKKKMCVYEKRTSTSTGGIAQTFRRETSLFGAAS